MESNRLIQAIQTHSSGDLQQLSVSDEKEDLACQAGLLIIKTTENALEREYTEKVYKVVKVLGEYTSEDEHNLAIGYLSTTITVGTGLLIGSVNPIAAPFVSTAAGRVSIFVLNRISDWAIGAPEKPIKSTKKPYLVDVASTVSRSAASGLVSFFFPGLGRVISIVLRAITGRTASKLTSGIGNLVYFRIVGGEDGKIMYPSGIDLMSSSLGAIAEDAVVSILPGGEETEEALEFMAKVAAKTGAFYFTKIASTNMGGKVYAMIVPPKEEIDKGWIFMDSGDDKKEEIELEKIESEFTLID